MKPAIIVAYAHHCVIGKNGSLPWRLSADLAHFKTLTLGKPIVMGRTTWASLPLKPLPGRRNIVLSRNQRFNPDRAEVAISISELETMLGNDEECMVIGGAQIYREFLDLVETIYLTEVNAEIDGDTYFPSLIPTQWIKTKVGDHQADDRNDYDIDFFTLQRKAYN